MNISTRFLTLTSILISAVGLQAQVVTPNPAPTIIKTAPYTINTPGFYQLGADLTVTNTSGNIITIAASNVTLDFGGHYISGPSNSSSTVTGVYANEEGNINIQNGTIAYCYHGVGLSGNGNANSLNINQRITNMLITYCYNIGIYLNEASYSQVSNNRISDITASAFAGSAYGVLDYSPQGNQVVNNTITNLTTAQNGYAIGIDSDSSNLVASNNTIGNVTNTYSAPNAYGIYSSAFAVGNTLRNCYYGIYDGKYQNNLTSGCNTPFSGGTDAGGNN